MSDGRTPERRPTAAQRTPERSSRPTLDFEEPPSVNLLLEDPHSSVDASEGRSLLRGDAALRAAYEQGYDGMIGQRFVIRHLESARGASLNMRRCTVVGRSRPAFPTPARLHVRGKQPCLSDQANDIVAGPQGALRTL